MDDDEARTADLEVVFTMPGTDAQRTGLTVSMYYHHRMRWSSVEHSCFCEWTRTGASTVTIIEGREWRLEVDELRAMHEV
jgi:hypothetical protein